MCEFQKSSTEEGTIMTVIKRKSYWKATAVGLFLAALITPLANFIGQETYLAKPDYALWQNYQEWRFDTELRINQRNFELAIADPNQLQLLDKNPRFQLVARQVHHARPTAFSRFISVATDTDWEFSHQFNGLVEKWQNCYGKTCSYQQPLQVLGDKQRLKKLLAGDTTAAIPAPNLIIPTKFKDVSMFDTTTIDRYHPYPWWWAWVMWGIFSLSCAVGYFGYGLSVYSCSRRNAEKSHPFRAVPDFILGWLMILLWLPGFLLGHILWSGYRLLTSPIAEIRKITAAHWRNLTSQTKHDEYTETYNQLVKLKREADHTGDTQLVIEIDQALSMIGEARNTTNTSATRDIREKLTKAKIAIRAHREIGRITNS
jgi:hypothetical protein